MIRPLQGTGHHPPTRRIERGTSPVNSSRRLATRDPIRYVWKTMKSGALVTPLVVRGRARGAARFRRRAANGGFLGTSGPEQRTHSTLGEITRARTH